MDPGGDEDLKTVAYIGAAVAAFFVTGWKILIGRQPRTVELSAQDRATITRLETKMDHNEEVHERLTGELHATNRRLDATNGKLQTVSNDLSGLNGKYKQFQADYAHLVKAFKLDRNDN